jgi:hypothetical protein
LTMVCTMCYAYDKHTGCARGGMMDMSTMGKHGVPIGAGKVRKTLTLPKVLVARVRTFRFRREFAQESDAYVWLLEWALEQVEREEQERGGQE